MHGSLQASFRRGLIVTGLVATAALVSGPGLAQAGLPEPDGFYKGSVSKATIPAEVRFQETSGEVQKRRVVEIKVSKSGRRLDWAGPLGCYIDPFPRYYARINGISVSTRGTFEKKRTYQLRDVAARGGDDGLLDVVWTIRVSVHGGFVTSRTAKGRISLEMTNHLELTSDPGHFWDPHGSAPPGPVSEASCGQHSGTWSATRAPYSSRTIIGRSGGPTGGR
jgi:hypothetical protein